MEIKINKEIRDYTESIFFGLSLRQFFFSALACAMAVLVYFLFKNYLSMETLSWICVLSAIPFGALGFFKYNGMTADEFFIAWFKSEILTPSILFFETENIYEKLLDEKFKQLEKEGLKVEVNKKKRKGKD